MTPYILQVTLYTPIKTGSSSATSACSDRKLAHIASDGRKMKANPLALLIRLRRMSPMRLSRPVLATPTATTRMPKMKNTASDIYAWEISLIGRTPYT